MEVWINKKRHTLPKARSNIRLLEFLREELGLMGTRYGCGMGLCGACTVHINGQAARACQTPLQGLSGKKITTIEGLASLEAPHPIQQAFVKFQVPQCGFCMSGQIMSATALFAKNPHPTTQQVNQAMSGNLCRCGTYHRIRKALMSASEEGK